MTLLLDRKMPTSSAPQHGSSRPSASAKVRVLDLAYETDLLHLLGRLDFLRRGIEKHRTEENASAALKKAATIAEHILELSQRHLPANFESVELRQSQANRREFDAVLIDLQGDLPTVSRWSLNRKTAPLDAEQKKRVKACFMKLGDYVKNSFTVFINRYPSSSSSRGWVEAAAIFLVDFNRMVREWNE